MVAFSFTRIIVYPEKVQYHAVITSCLCLEFYQHHLLEFMTVRDSIHILLGGWVTVFELLMT